MVEQIHLCHCWRGRTYLMEINTVLNFLCIFFLQVFAWMEQTSPKYGHYGQMPHSDWLKICLLLKQKDHHKIIFITFDKFRHSFIPWLPWKIFLSLVLMVVIGLCLLIHCWLFLKHRCALRIVIPWCVWWRLFCRDHLCICLSHAYVDWKQRAWWLLLDLPSGYPTGMRIM